MRKHKFAVVTALTLALSIGMTSAGVLADQHEKSPTPTYKDVTIATVDDKGVPFELRTDIFLPKKKGKTEPTPLVLFIHGNGGAYNFSNGSRSYALSIALANRGIAVASIDYRPKTGLPENVYDVKAYVRYFKANAEKYNIDPYRVAVWGTSRGGNLASLLATTGDEPQLEGDVGGNLDQSSSIHSAVIYYPFTDVFLYDDPAGTLVNFYGVQESDAGRIIEAHKNNDTNSPYWETVEKIRLLNPMNHVDENDPPALITIGGNDTVTPINHSTALFNKYLEEGVDASLYAWAPGVHGKVGTDIEAATAEWLVNKLFGEKAEQ